MLKIYVLKEKFHLLLFIIHLIQIQNYSMKPIFVPLLHNGNGSVMANFMMCHGEAFAGLTIDMRAIGDSHAGRGMNKVANDFLTTDCDVWINIDADIRFRRVDVDRLLEHAERGVPLAYGIYPKKEDITQACLCTLTETPPVVDLATGLAEVRRSGRGFMLVKREVLERMKEDNGGPALRFHNHGPVQWDFFVSGVVTGEFSALDRQGIGTAEEADTGLLKDSEGYPVREWISEDWYFCERARKLGIPTLVDTRIALGHVGHKTYWFTGDQITRLDSNITNWRDIHGWFDYEVFYKYLAELLPDGARFVEVGCWLGRSIAAMHEFSEKAGKKFEIHVVDKFIGDLNSPSEVYAAILKAHNGNVEEHFRGNMKALGLEPNIIAADSATAAGAFTDGSVDCAFIDADHSAEAVAKDIAAWLPKIKPGGVLCGHDIDESGVASAVWNAFGKDIEIHGRCWLRRLTPVPMHVDHGITERATALVHQGAAYTSTFGSVP